MDMDDFGRNIILESLEPGGESWLELSYEEGLAEVDDFFPSPELRPASPAALPSFGEQTSGPASAGKAEELDGLMEDLDEIEDLENSGATLRDGDDIVMQDGNMTNAVESDVNMAAAFRTQSPTIHSEEIDRAASPTASICADEDDSPTASDTESPQLPTVHDLNESTRFHMSNGRSIDRSSVALPSSERRSSMQKEMQQEDEDATDAAKAPVLPSIPPLKGLGLTRTVTSDTPKTLVGPLQEAVFLTSESQLIVGQENTPSIRARSVPAVGTSGVRSKDLVEGSLTVPSSPILQKRGRKHARAPSNPLENAVGCDTAPTSPTRPMAKKPRRRGRTNSQNELQVDNEAVQNEMNIEKEQEMANHSHIPVPQSSTSMNLNESDSSFTDLSLNSSSLPSGDSWDFGALDKTSRPASDDRHEMNIDDEVESSHPAPKQTQKDNVQDSPIPFKPRSLTRKDSLIEPESEPQADETSASNTAASTPTKFKPANKTERKQVAFSTLRSAMPSRTSSPTTRPTRSTLGSQPPHARKAQSREVAALAGVLGIHGDKTDDSPRKTRGQQKAVELASPNASKAAKKRHTGAVDYSKML